MSTFTPHQVARDGGLLVVSNVLVFTQSGKNEHVAPAHRSKWERLEIPFFCLLVSNPRESGTRANKVYEKNVTRRISG